jgi:hypothetical protein
MIGSPFVELTDVIQDKGYVLKRFCTWLDETHWAILNVLARVIWMQYMVALVRSFGNQTWISLNWRFENYLRPRVESMFYKGLIDIG